MLFIQRIIYVTPRSLSFVMTKHLFNKVMHSVSLRQLPPGPRTLLGHTPEGRTEDQAEAGPRGPRTRPPIQSSGAPLHPSETVPMSSCAPRGQSRAVDACSATVTTITCSPFNLSPLLNKVALIYP